MEVRISELKRILKHAINEGRNTREEIQPVIDFVNSNGLEEIAELASKAWTKHDKLGDECFDDMKFGGRGKLSGSTVRVATSLFATLKRLCKDAEAATEYVFTPELTRIQNELERAETPQNMSFSVQMHMHDLLEKVLACACAAVTKKNKMLKQRLPSAAWGIMFTNGLDV